MDPPDPAIWDAFDGRPHQLRMGLHPIEPAAWTQLPPAPELGAELDRRARLLSALAREVIDAIDDPRVGDAAGELWHLLVEHLCRDHPSRYRVEGPTLTLLDDGRTWDLAAVDPLRIAGSAVTEDWCLIRPEPVPILAAAVLCSPNRWRLGDKLGRPITDIHDPVPGYRRRLGPPVDALLGSVRGPSWRRNWSIQSSPSRYQPVADGPARPAVPDQVWVRSEYETLVRLPESGWWVFGIHTTVRPLTDVAGAPALAARILRAVASLDPATARYKDLAAWRVPLERWLAGIAAATPPDPPATPPDPP